MNAVAKTEAQTHAEIMENVLIRGDIAKLTIQERGQYYFQLCESLGLNSLTQPFEYIQLNGKLKLYAKKDCTDQLRFVHGVSVTELLESERDSVFIVKAKVVNAKGRTDVSTGAVNIKGLQGEALANALMKAETKAKRRATLSICGLGMLDETEIEDIPASAKGPVERPRVPSPSDPVVRQVEPPKSIKSPDPIVQPSQPGEGPHKIVGGTYASWADAYIEAIGTSGDPATVMAWVDANTAQLEKLAKGSAPDAGRVKVATEKHLAFLRKTAPKGTDGDAEQGSMDMDGPAPVQPKPATTRGKGKKAPDFTKDYDGWLTWTLDQIAKAETPEQIETMFERIDGIWSELMPPDKEALLGARREAETRLEQ
jgi:hypothetical protein